MKTEATSRQKAERAVECHRHVCICSSACWSFSSKILFLCRDAEFHGDPWSQALPDLSESWLGGSTLLGLRGANYNSSACALIGKHLPIVDAPALGINTRTHTHTLPTIKRLGTRTASRGINVTASSLNEQILFFTKCQPSLISQPSSCRCLDALPKQYTKDIGDAAKQWDARSRTPSSFPLPAFHPRSYHTMLRVWIQSKAKSFISLVVRGRVV
ncbi:hypothetical protein QBC46DRAFT_84012 [Diplogelasinospora grovesii]|uniref:Uncharacterized protein n=1 Tax=Diplogelasinospora grovesii TaxID=303347 RepID=A0AAN6NA60_9PEZI|nr:hypothetical protein QBC46DRAFT_84012 [Diplogelasinospora grovesii]